MSRAKTTASANQVTLVPMGVSGFRQERDERVQVDYGHILKALKNSDLNSPDGAGELTGIHYPDYTITVEKLRGSKYRRLGSFGWAIWIKVKPRNSQAPS